MTRPEEYIFEHEGGALVEANATVLHCSGSGATANCVKVLAGGAHSGKPFQTGRNFDELAMSANLKSFPDSARRDTPRNPARQ